jgi:hypothetical protein
MNLKFIYLPLMLCFVFLFNSCDDSGITADKKKIEFSFTGLQRLNQQVDGVYEGWLSVGSGLDHDDNSYRSVGRFNISASGQLVDTAGNPASLNLSRISDVNLTEDALITSEQPGDNDTLPGIKLLGGVKTIVSGSLVFEMSMGYSEILPVSGQFAGATARYMLASPTNQYASNTPQLGIWFSLDTNGSSTGLTLPTLPDTAEWTYQAWIVDNLDSVNNIYNIGRFTRSDQADDNSQCKGPNNVWNVPGSDWIQPNCPGGGIPDIVNLNNSNYKVWITLEPKSETNGLPRPFFIRLFYGTVLVTGGFGNTFSVGNTTSLPTAQIRLSVN